MNSKDTAEVGMPEYAVVAGETHSVSNLVHFRTPPIWRSTHVKDAVMMRIIMGIAFYVIIDDGMFKI